jgi:hypothetical protein
MMIEAVPFFHILVNLITAEVGEDKVRSSNSKMREYKRLNPTPPPFTPAARHHPDRHGQLCL